MVDKGTSILHFKFDVSTFRLLGRELITDRITALFELVKNSYDANAQNVSITFTKVNPLSSESRIIIEDDGLGMTYEDIRDKWMVIGTSSKRKKSKSFSPEPYHRAVAGKKGVGRFAVDKLGAKLILKTKKTGSNVWNCLETDWAKYSKEEDRQLSLQFDDINEDKPLFTDIDNSYWTEVGDNNKQGTVLEISSLGDVWTENDIARAYHELSKIVRPTIDTKYPFNIRIKAKEYAEYSDKKVESMFFSKATLSFSLGYRYDEVEKKYYQKYLKTEDGELKTEEKEAEIFGPVVLVIYYYNKEAKGKFRTSIKNDQIDGIKVYRDGLIATPFAEYKSDRNEQKDLFGIDKRRWSGFFDKLSTQDILGWVDIKNELNPNIIDSTNRQDFVDNKEWSELKKFVIDQIFQIEKALKYKKEAKKKENSEKLNNAESELSEIKNRINKVKKSANFLSPELEKELDDVTNKLGVIRDSVSASSKDMKNLEEEKKQQENIMFSLVSLQTYAGLISHIIKTSIGQIERSAEFVAKYTAVEDKKDKCIIHANRVAGEMQNLTKAINFMLTYAKDDSTFEPFNVKDVITNLFGQSYAELFNNERIKVESQIDDDFELVYNKKAFQDMFGNLVDNSVKALRNNKDKRIKCSVTRVDNFLVILFSDNGIGIPEENKDRIFNVFFTTTADFGGAGLGLYIIRTRLEAIKGEISLEKNEFKPTGATFKITIPLKNS